MIFRNIMTSSEDSGIGPGQKILTKVSRHKNLTCLVTFIFIICIICGVLIEFALRVRNFVAVDLPSSNQTSRTIQLESELVSLDPVASNMVMNWYIIGDTCLGNDSSIIDHDSDVIPDSCTPVNITFDTNLLRLNGDDWDKKLDNQDPSVPIFTWFPATLNSNTSKFPGSRTTSALFSKQAQKASQDANLQNYPFDPYQAGVVAFGRDKQNNTVNLEIAFSTGIAVGFSATSEDFSDGSGTILNIITFSRNTLVKAYVFIIVIGVWIITLIFVGSVCKVIFGYPQPTEAFVIPIDTLFAVTSLRGSMPGAPSGFGAIIDFVGILPCLAIVTLTGVYLFAYLVLAQNIEGAISETMAEHKAKEKLLTPANGI